MNFESKKYIDVLESESLFEYRENGLLRTSYETEKRLYSFIKNGDVENAKKAGEFLKTQKIVAGKLSDNSLTHMKYWAVCCITLATRSAIEGGLDENIAYTYADKTIMKIDKMNSESEIFSTILNEYVKISVMVCENHKEKPCSVTIKRCLHYISTHLHEKLSVRELSSHCGLSPDHFSKIFKSEVGIIPSRYIRRKKLEAAKEMLLSGRSISETAHFLGFCSDSYFIDCFKSEFSKTPREFLKTSD